MIPSHSIVALVPAAGIGTRMRTDKPKQYLKIDDKTVLEYTLESLLSCHHISHIIVVISKTDHYFGTLPVANHPKITSVTGGETRAESVLSGLKYITDSHWVLVHDAVRPCVTQEDVNKLIDQVLASECGGILAIPIVDTVKQAQRHLPDRIEKTLDRNFLWHAVTPQLFSREMLKSALEKALQDHITITDEASAIEYQGGQPLLVKGRSDNIKITRPEDLRLATFYLRERSPNTKKDNRETTCE